MQCPECHSPNDTNAGSCPSCGLLLMNLKPKRRAEDLASQKRRKNDQEAAQCPYCAGDILPTAVRCRHCSEIVDDDYYRARAQRTRARVNYTSWVAYIFGLGALLVFRPVGLVSIGAGLLLSILYYAIPVDPPATKLHPHRRKPLVKRLARQLKLERVSIPIPALRKKRLVFIGTPLVAALIGYSANIFLLQEPMNDVLRQNAAFRGMNVSAHYEYWVVPGVVVYDLRDLSFRQTPIDVHTAFLEFAKKMRNAKLKRVELSYRGTTKYSIDGTSFRRLGEEYAKRNFDYVLYTFPRLFHSVGTAAPAAATGSSDRDALLQFHRHWYGEDVLTRSVANAM